MNPIFNLFLPFVVLSFAIFDFGQDRKIDYTDCSYSSDSVSAEAEYYFHVEGLDSINVFQIQSSLDELGGMIMNYACYMDSLVYVKYDTIALQMETIERVLGEAQILMIRNNK